MREACGIFFDSSKLQFAVSGDAANELLDEYWEGIFSPDGEEFDVKCTGVLEAYEPLEGLKNNHYAKLYSSQQS